MMPIRRCRAGLNAAMGDRAESGDGPGGDAQQQQQRKHNVAQDDRALGCNP